MVETDAVKHLISFKINLTNAINDLSEVAVKNASGTTFYPPSYLETLQRQLFLLLEIRNKVK